MKYRLRNTGKVYDSIRDAVEDYCKGRACGECGLYPWATDPNIDCYKVVENDPALLAEIGGEMLGDGGAETGAPAAQMTRAGVLDAARKCVCGGRDQDYGSPESSFQAIASLWNGYLCAAGLMGAGGAERKGLTPKDVAAMMCLFKAARIATGRGKADNWIDLAGYAACGGEIEGTGCQA